MKTSLPLRHFLLALAVVAVWVLGLGLIISAWWLGERLPGWKLGAAALVMAGLALNLLWPLLLKRLNN